MSQFGALRFTEQQWDQQHDETNSQNNFCPIMSKLSCFTIHIQYPLLTLRARYSAPASPDGLQHSSSPAHFNIKGT
jgi:hypothetical protein